MKLTTLAIFAVSLVLLWCSSWPSQQWWWSLTRWTSPEIIKVGVIVPLSWPAAAIGEDAVHTFKLAANEFNSSQQKFTIQLILEDWKCEWQSATAAAQKLVNIDQVKIILWGVCSAETLAASKITEPAGVVLISSTSSSPEISKIPNYTYRYYNDFNQVATLVEYLTTHWLDKVALIYENTDFGIWYVKTIRNQFGEANIILEEKFNTEEKDLTIIAKKITAKQKDIKAIVFVPNSDSPYISMFRALEKEWLIQTFQGKILWPETIGSNNVISQLGDILQWVKTTQLPDGALLGQQANEFITIVKQSYTPKYAEMFIILYKDTFDLVAKAISDPAYGPTKVNEYIKSITKDNPTSWLIGTYYFSWADVIELKFVMKEIKDWLLVPVE